MMTLHDRCMAYQQTRCMDERQQFILDCMPLVEQFARKHRTLYAHYWQVEDTVSLGVMGVMECLESYDGLKNTSFEAYLVSKLKFKLIDELRKYGFVPRRVSQKAKQVNDALECLTQDHMRTISDEELANHLNMSVSELSLHYHEVSMNYLMSMEEVIESSGDRFLEDKLHHNPEEIFFANELKHHLKNAILKLSEKEQMLIHLYYVEQFKLKEIGQIFEVSEARVCQMHANVIKTLKDHLKEIIDE